MKNFASHCDTELRFHDTEEQAIGQAHRDIASCREQANDGWPEDVANEICVMKVVYRAAKVDPDADYRAVDYQLVRDEGGGQCVQCGGPMARNTHEAAGKMATLLSVGAVFECIPCMVHSRHSWCQRALAAERQVRELKEYIEKLDHAPR